MVTQAPSNGQKFDMRQPDETWKNFIHLAVWTIVLSTITLVGMALFLTGGNPPAGQ
ncbi:MAG: hypothetical protein HY057_13220 [Rhodospirillales bacterium]|nr:hypothetical protein [Rhodospirillales bacterium]